MDASTVVFSQTSSQIPTCLITATTIGNLTTMSCDLHSQDGLRAGERGVVDKDLFHPLDFLVTYFGVGHRDSVKNEGESFEIVRRFTVESFESVEGVTDFVRNIRRSVVAGW